MADNEVILSTREAELLERFADEQGVSPGQVLADMYRRNIRDRLDIKRKQGEVRTFRLPERD